MQKPNPKIGKYTFDKWMALAKDDPEQFEAERKRMVDGVISLAPEERSLRLQRLQFQVDMVRKKYRHNNLVSTQKIYFLMWESFKKLTQALAEPSVLSYERNGKSAQVFQLFPKQDA